MPEIQLWQRRRRSILSTAKEWRTNSKKQTSVFKRAISKPPHQQRSSPCLYNASCPQSLPSTLPCTTATHHFSKTHFLQLKCGWELPLAFSSQRQAAPMSEKELTHEAHTSSTNLSLRESFRNLAEEDSPAMTLATQVFASKISTRSIHSFVSGL